MWMATGKGRIFVNYLQWNRDGIKISGFQKVGYLVRLKTREGFAYKQKFKKNISIETLCKKSWTHIYKYAGSSSGGGVGMLEAGGEI